MKPDEIAKLTAYMRRALGSDAIELRARPKKADSAEVYARDEFVGVVTRDDEDGPDDVSYNFDMAILASDL